MANRSPIFPIAAANTSCMLLLKMAKARPHNGGLYAWPDWYLIRDYCVGFIVNWGVHHLDIANWGCPALTSEPCELEFAGSYRNDGLTDNINEITAYLKRFIRTVTNDQGSSA